MSIEQIGMDDGQKNRAHVLDSYLAARHRLMQFIHQTLIMVHLKEKRIVPENIMGSEFDDFFEVLQDAQIGYFATLMDKNASAVDILYLWKKLFPQFKEEIDTFEQSSRPIMKLVHDYRDNVSFHCNKSLERQIRLRIQKIENAKKISETIQNCFDLAIKTIKVEHQLPDLAGRLKCLSDKFSVSHPRLTPEFLAKYLFGKTTEYSPD